MVRSWGILRRTGATFFADNVPRLGAALAFYTTIAVAPLIILATSLASFVFEEAEARGQIMGEIERLAGERVVESLETVAEARADTQADTRLHTVGGVVLLFGALVLFRQMRLSLNSIWRVGPPEDVPWWRLVLDQVFSTATAAGTAFLLLVSLIFSALVNLLWSRSAAFLPLTEEVALAINQLLSLAIVTLLFGITYKVLPQRTVPWRHVWTGAFFTALLFTLGQFALSFYLGRSAITSGYGAAGSVLALLVWCYYTAQIFFFGAELTRISTLSEGGRDFTEVDRQMEAGEII
ncbi:MAG: YihY/virulence factor BrkB family protein [Opitutales bacterium]